MALPPLLPPAAGGTGVFGGSIVLTADFKGVLVWGDPSGGGGGGGGGGGVVGSAPLQRVAAPNG